jgi:PilZ domain
MRATAMNEAMREKRVAPRHRVFKHGVLAFSGGGSVDCTVRSLSATGARIDVASPIGLPDNFVLMIESDHFTRHCHSVWSKDKQIGVAFD